MSFDVLPVTFCCICLSVWKQIKNNEPFDQRALQSAEEVSIGPRGPGQLQDDLICVFQAGPFHCFWLSADSITCLTRGSPDRPQASCKSFSVYFLLLPLSFGWCTRLSLSSVVFCDSTLCCRQGAERGGLPSLPPACVVFPFSLPASVVRLPQSMRPGREQQFLVTLEEPGCPGDSTVALILGVPTLGKGADV